MATVLPRMFVDDPAGAVRFLREVFGAEGAFVGDRPAEMVIGDSVVLVSGTADRGRFPVFLYVYVGDTDAAFGRAVGAGAEVLEEPTQTPYGQRRAMVRDPYGNVFQIAAV
ncbi:VOC family protein [Kutzneria buriramensis]|uniref:Putative glyoxalase superfamily protein PhnB n=1 Tax=Kutzneria buriramensis TaxID=1045776 RepID=A0A3E0GWY5_9PSEU|nr:VOC family protein [Kutzneria buriramensis]REH32655.1 putative glyoxalase superfamily protein PhnB [Kutzneria buriramensis]